MALVARNQSLEGVWWPWLLLQTENVTFLCFVESSPTTLAAGNFAWNISCKVCTLTGILLLFCHNLLIIAYCYLLSILVYLMCIYLLFCIFSTSCFRLYSIIYLLSLILWPWIAHSFYRWQTRRHVQTTIIYCPFPLKITPSHQYMMYRHRNFRQKMHPVGVIFNLWKKTIVVVFNFIALIFLSCYLSTSSLKTHTCDT